MANVWEPIFAKPMLEMAKLPPIVSSPKYAIFSPQCCILIRLQAPKAEPKGQKEK